MFTLFSSMLKQTNSTPLPKTSSTTTTSPPPFFTQEAKGKCLQVMMDTVKSVNVNGTVYDKSKICQHKELFSNSSWIRLAERSPDNAQHIFTNCDIVKNISTLDLKRIALASKKTCQIIIDCPHITSEQREIMEKYLESHDIGRIGAEVATTSHTPS